MQGLCLAFMYLLYIYYELCIHCYVNYYCSIQLTKLIKGFVQLTLLLFDTRTGRDVQIN